MAFHDLLVSEIFHSIQGETSLAGKPFAFIRLSGCNLRCTYCDTPYAFKGGERLSIETVLERIVPFGTRDCVVTGGEPLLQRRTPELLRALRDAGYLTSLETHGEVSIARVSGLARIIMDIKTPSSGMARMGFRENLPHLTESDEIKFVIGSEEDYDWARAIVLGGTLPTREILFSPVTGLRQQGLPPDQLAERILRDRLPVRLQLQLHKILWGADRRGV